jgi:4-oxalocrotonate tautomerase
MMNPGSPRRHARSDAVRSGGQDPAVDERARLPLAAGGPRDSVSALRRPDGGGAMPFVNITIYEGHGKDRKDEIARRVTDTITDVCKLPHEAVWVVFNEVTPPDWYVAGNPGKK